MAVSFDRIVRNFNNRIEEPVRKHLRNVYACLTMSAASAAVGAYVNVYTRMLSGALLSTLPAFGLLLALHFTPPNGKNNNLRLGYLLGFAFFAVLTMTAADKVVETSTRVGMGPLINYAIAVDPSIIITALIGTVTVFSCFTLSVLFSPRGYWLFITGPISTVLSTLFFLSLANIFFASQWIYQINIYAGLLAICGFVIYDTTIIMEKCRMNDKDFIGHSVDLFVDFIGIFKRLLIILTEKENRPNSRSKNK